MRHENVSGSCETPSCSASGPRNVHTLHELVCVRKVVTRSMPRFLLVYATCRHMRQKGLQSHEFACAHKKRAIVCFPSFLGFSIVALRTLSCLAFATEGVHSVISRFPFSLKACLCILFLTVPSRFMKRQKCCVEVRKEGKKT
jgi:hypothetical protein